MKLNDCIGQCYDSVNDEYWFAAMLALYSLLRLFLVFASLCNPSTTEKFLPRGQYGLQHGPAFAELHNVILGRGDGSLVKRNAVPYPRKEPTRKPLNKRKAAGLSAALELRNVLLVRQRRSCQSGYSFCQCKWHGIH